MFKNEIKAIIWDLDETIWDGSLAENDNVVLRNDVVELIKQFNSNGIINSICSKNEYSLTKTKLEQSNLWDYFVFPSIDFTPKGLNIKEIIADLQLKEQNVVFIDDNVGNINEAIYYCPQIMVGDINDKNFVDELLSYAKDLKGKSRLEYYKLLEKKKIERKSFSENNDFLIESNIEVYIVRNPMDLIFKDRIQELANRTNQLNFTKSRFPEMNVLEEYLEGNNSIHLSHGCIFVFDKYGDYGLVGFYAFDERRDKRNLEHFYFSCRILNMNIEYAVLNFLKNNYKVKEFTGLERSYKIDTSFIKISTKMDDRLELYLNKKEIVEEDYETTVVAGCSSGIISHYLDQKFAPVSFGPFDYYSDNLSIKEGRNVVITIFSYYMNEKNNLLFSYKNFNKRLKEFLSQNQNKNIFLIIGSSKNISNEPNDSGLLSFVKKIYHNLLGKSFYRVKRCNHYVQLVSKQYKNVYVFDPAEFLESKKEQINSRHFDRIVYKRICNKINEYQIPKSET